MKVLQEWEGHVIEVTEHMFFAKLIDLTNDNPEEEGEFPIERIHPEERKYIKLGAIFRWKICEQIFSSIKFNKECWTKEEIEMAKKRGKELYENLNWGKAKNDS